MKSFADIAEELSTTVQTVPNLVKVLKDGFQDVEAGGSVVEVEAIQTTGTKIATITVDNEDTDLYAPAGGTIYSTDEKVIGTWVDGKPIYEKTWTGLDVTATTAWLQLTDVSIPDIANVINCKLFRESSDTPGTLVAMQISEYGPNDPTFTCIQVKVGSDSANKKIKIVVAQYTKSTD